MMPRALFKNTFMIGIGAAVLAAVCGIDQAAAQPCPTMRKINIAVSVAPPNVVHTSPYVAKALGFFDKRCIDATIVQFEGGQSADLGGCGGARAARSPQVSDVSIGRGLKVQQVWGLAPRMPQAYMVPGDVKTAADLKGKRLSATGGGVGGFNWRMGREVLKSAKLDVGDAQFIPSPTAGRLPGLIAGQIDGVALHPEDVFLARKQKDEPASAGAARRADAALHVQRLRRLHRMDRQGPRAASRHGRRDDRSQPHHLSRAGQGGADHRRRRPSRRRRSNSPSTCNIKNCIWSVNSGLYPAAHAVVDRQQRRERRHQTRQEADRRAGGQHEASPRKRSSSPAAR